LVGLRNLGGGLEHPKPPLGTPLHTFGILMEFKTGYESAHRSLAGTIQHYRCDTVYCMRNCLLDFIKRERDYLLGSGGVKSGGIWWPNVSRDKTVTKKVPEHVCGFISSVESSTVLLKLTVMFVQF